MPDGPYAPQPPEPAGGCEGLGFRLLSYRADASHCRAAFSFFCRKVAGVRSLIGNMNLNIHEPACLLHPQPATCEMSLDILQLGLQLVVLGVCSRVHLP